jgi:hypothetical protein
LKDHTFMGLLSRLFKKAPPAPVLPIPDVPFGLVPVHGRDVAQQMQLLRDRKGCWPVLLGDREDMDYMLGCSKSNFEEPPGMSQMGRDFLSAGLALDVDNWVAAQIREVFGNSMLAGDQTFESWIADDNAPRPPLRPASDVFACARDSHLPPRPKPEVFIGLIPVEHPWEIPAYLKCASGDDYPTPDVHVAMFRHWFEHHGARVTTVAGASIEFFVERPPTDRAAARTLAIEQTAYCSDLLFGGLNTASIGQLTSCLIDCPVWSFWWD